MLDEATLRRILASLPNLAIGVVGDIFLDKYLDLDASLTETSVETGLNAYQIARVRCYAGAGGTVLNNLRALGVGRLCALSVIGDDGEGFELSRALRTQQVSIEGVLASSQRMTPTYTKPMLSQATGPARELNRLDINNRTPQSADLDRQVMERLEQLVPQMDAVIVADQVTERNLGVVTDAVRERLCDLAVRHPTCRFFADSRSHIGLFRNMIAKPNQQELQRAVDGSGLATAEQARRLVGQTGRPVFATIGSEGILYVDEQSVQQIPGITVEGPIDIVGAGDSTMAGIVSALCSGATPAQAARLGCLVASITIGQLGVTGSATPEQVIARWSETVK
ncbi:MAG: carbohydrate kinase [Planctomycetaceae bacterium]|nr:carbohydrate kinase [Planctomycetaceae bacterium]